MRFSFIITKLIYINGIISAGSSLLKIRQTLSNSICNRVNVELLKKIKNTSHIFFKNLYLICKMQAFKIGNELSEEGLEILNKYNNPYSLILSREDMKEKNIEGCPNVIKHLLMENELSEKVDHIDDETFSGFYGEKEDIHKISTVIDSQQFPNKSPSIATLKKIHKLIS